MEHYKIFYFHKQKLYRALVEAKNVDVTRTLFLRAHQEKTGLCEPDDISIKENQKFFYEGRVISLGL